MPLTQEQIETLTINRNSSEQTDQTQNIAYEVKSLEETINIMCIHAERLKPHSSSPLAAPKSS